MSSRHWRGTQRALTERMQLETFGLSIAGRRANNEDAICARPELGLFVVADGMGGYEGGEIASALAVEAIHELVRRTAGDADVTWPYKIDPTRSIIENEVLVATRLANERITLRRTGELCEMGSTVVVLRLEDDHAVIGHVGDSRLYRLRAGVVTQLTIDHSLTAQLEASGMKPAADWQWRHVVTRALGTATGEPEIARVEVCAGDVYLLCSDGLSEVLDNEEIAALLAHPPELACRALIDAAYAAGSRDNISAVVVRVS
jgi:serine/threonine protein phosphatase PrpC